MLNKENVKTIADLVREAGRIHGERVFVRYEKEDRIKEMSFWNFYELCKAVAGWTEEKNKENELNLNNQIISLKEELANLKEEQQK